VIDIANMMTDGFLDGGWGTIEKPGSRAREATQRMVDTRREDYLAKCAILDKAFGTEDGRAALAVLVAMTLARPASEQENLAARSAEEYAICKAIRDGQNNIVFTIFEMLRVARGADPLPGGEG
jgi:hypothetical protein